jgi:transposase-like protein
MFKGINAIEFNKRFRNNEDCYKYLENLKWGKIPYQCIRCECKEFNKGRTCNYRRCKNCGYDESVTANTIFHGLRMPILKAFHMIFRLSAKKKGMSTVELGNEVGVQQKTAWYFKRKIQSVMDFDNNEKLKGIVDVDETLVGGYSAGKPGRSLETKSAVFVAVEILEDGRTGNLNLEKIDNFKAETLKNAIEKFIDEDASIKTDKFHSYKKLEKEMPNLTTAYSEKGNEMEQLHKQIMQFKNWLRGVHHKCSKEYLFAYINEYVYRFNKRNMKQWLFNDILKRIINAKPMTYSMLKIVCEQNT